MTLEGGGILSRVRTIIATQPLNSGWKKVWVDLLVEARFTPMHKYPAPGNFLLLLVSWLKGL